MLVFSEVVLEKLQHFIFSVFYKGLLLLFQKMNLVVLTKITIDNDQLWSIKL